VPQYDKPANSLSLADMRDYRAAVFLKKALRHVLEKHQKEKLAAPPVQRGEFRYKILRQWRLFVKLLPGVTTRSDALNPSKAIEKRAVGIVVGYGAQGRRRGREP